MVNILHICDKKYYKRKMSRVRFHYMRALEKLPGVASFKYWGNGWLDYDSSISLQENINKLDTVYDLIICYKPLEHIGFKDVKIPKVISYNEMEPFERTLNEIKESGACLVICHHKNEMDRFVKAYPEVKYVHIPHCSDPKFFKDYGLEKIYDIVVVGRLSSEAYPLRTRLSQIVQSMAPQYTIKIHTHPGYDIKNAHDDHLTVDFAKFINQSKIAVFCSGKDHTRFSKYSEVAACAAAVAADIPDDDLSREEMKDFVIELSMSMSDEEIKNKLVNYLNNPELLKRCVDLGRVFANKYTTQYYAKRMLEEISAIVMISKSLKLACTGKTKSNVVLT